MDIKTAREELKDGFGLKMGVIGGRDFTDHLLLNKWIKHCKNAYSIEIIVSGGKRPDCKGADTLAENWADYFHHPKLIFPPQLKDGMTDYEIKGAFLERNTKIAIWSDFILAFWDGKSRGTLDTMTKAWERDKLSFIVDYNGKPGIFKL